MRVATIIGFRRLPLDGAWLLKEGQLKERIRGATVVLAGLIALKL